MVVAGRPWVGVSTTPVVAVVEDCMGNGPLLLLLVVVVVVVGGAPMVEPPLALLLPIKVEAARDVRNTVESFVWWDCEVRWS